MKRASRSRSWKRARDASSPYRGLASADLGLIESRLTQPRGGCLLGVGSEGVRSVRRLFAQPRFSAALTSEEEAAFTAFRTDSVDPTAPNDELWAAILHPASVGGSRRCPTGYTRYRCSTDS